MKKRRDPHRHLALSELSAADRGGEVAGLGTARGLLEPRVQACEGVGGTGEETTPQADDDR